MTFRVIPFIRSTGKVRVDSRKVAGTDRKWNEHCIKMHFRKPANFSPIFSHSATAPPADEVSSDEFAIFLHTFFASSVGAWQARVLTRFRASLTPHPVGALTDDAINAS